MAQYIDKATVIAEIEKRKKRNVLNEGAFEEDIDILSFLDSIEVIDPYEQRIQYSSIEDGIKAHAEVYSFNIESELFNQLTKEQQTLWRKEIEQACISGGDVGVELARDIRYKEIVEVKEVDLDKEIDNIWNPRFNLGWDEKSLLSMNHEGFTTIAKHFFELGLKAQKGE